MPPLPTGPVQSVTAPCSCDAKNLHQCGPPLLHYHQLLKLYLSSLLAVDCSLDRLAPHKHHPPELVLSLTHVQCTLPCLLPVSCQSLVLLHALPLSMSDFHESCTSTCVLPDGTVRTYGRTRATPSILNSDHLFRYK